VCDTVCVLRACILHSKNKLALTPCCFISVQLFCRGPLDQHVACALQLVVSHTSHSFNPLHSSCTRRRRSHAATPEPSLVLKPAANCSACAAAAINMCHCVDACAALAAGAQRSGALWRRHSRRPTVGELFDMRFAASTLPSRALVHNMSMNARARTSACECTGIRIFAYACGCWLTAHRSYATTQRSHDIVPCSYIYACVHTRLSAARA